MGRLFSADRRRRYKAGGGGSGGSGGGLRGQLRPLLPPLGVGREKTRTREAPKTLGAAAYGTPKALGSGRSEVTAPDPR